MFISAEHEISNGNKKQNADEYILQVNVKIPNQCWHFSIYEHDKLPAQLSIKIIYSGIMDEYQISVNEEMEAFLSLTLCFTEV